MEPPPAGGGEGMCCHQRKERNKEMRTRVFMCTVASCIRTMCMSRQGMKVLISFALHCVCVAFFLFLYVNIAFVFLLRYSSMMTNLFGLNNSTQFKTERVETAIFDLVWCCFCCGFFNRFCERTLSFFPKQKRICIKFSLIFKSFPFFTCFYFFSLRAIYVGCCCCCLWHIKQDK